MKKTVANRRMFRQGGAVNSGPTGILASSPSLIDAVAQDAMNVQGGPTVRMADGGIVRMANGGSIGDYLPTQNAPLGLRFPRSGRRIQLGFQVPEDERRVRAEMTSEELMKLFPADASLEGGFLGAQRLRTEGDPSFFAGITKSPSTPLGEIASVPYAVFDQMARRLSRGGTKAAQVVADVAEGLVTTRPEGKDYQTHFGQIMAVNDMVRRAPTVTGVSQEDIGAEIAELGKRIVAQEPDIPPDELKKYITGEIYTKYEGSVPIPGEGLDYEDVDMRPQDVTGLAVEEFPEDLGQDDTLDEDDARGTPSIVPAVPKEGEVEPKAPPKSGGAFNEGVDTVMGPGDQELDPNAMKRRTETPGVSAEAVKQIKDAAKSGNEEETKNKLEDYINEFKSAIPEYEGKSEAEKGFDLVKMGMAVAAGESPEAITNISKGVLATIDNFTEDEKAKRAYKQQVAMSAAKYGLQNLRKDREQLAADAKENRALFKDVFRVKAGETFTKADGTVAKEGDTVILTVGDIRGGKVDTSKLITEKNLIQQIKTKNSVAAANLDILKNKTTAPNKFTSTSKQYIKDGMRLRTNIATQSLLNRSLVELQKPGGEGPLGIKATAKNMLLSLANSVNEKEFAESVFGPLDSQKKFDDFTNRAVTTQIEGLINEGGKITDQERKLAKEIGGALSKGAFSGVFEDRTKLERQIKEFSQALQRDSEARSRQMGLAERAWADHYTTIDQVGKGPSYGQMLRAARPKLRGASSPMASRILPGSINWTDIVSTDDKGTVTGFKRDWNSKK